MKNVAIIPARIGSKRIPKKNIRPFCGKPLIGYSIEEAKATGLFDRIIVSTDSQEIADIANEFGAETPFLRPAELSDDHTLPKDVLIHAINWLHENGYFPSFFCCILATAPFVEAQYIKEGFDLLRRDKDATESLAITTFSYPIFRSLSINDSGKVRMIWPEYIETLSQDLPEAFHDAGQFYWYKTEKYLAEKCVLSDHSIPVHIPRYLVQDIDTMEDWKTAELMFQVLNLKRSNNL